MFGIRWLPRKDEVVRCSFCDKPQNMVEKIISGPDDKPTRVYICNECVAVCSRVLEEDKKAKTSG